MTRPVLILQHVPWERPALLGDILIKNGLEYTLDNITMATDSSALPGVDEVSAVVILGGPMGALDVDEFPGLALEAQLVRDAVDAGVPLFGICLGHQIVATALGAALHSGAADEIGIGTVRVVTDDAIFGTAGLDQAVLHWHGDVVDTPPGAITVASTDQTPNQAFRLGDSVFATQFHLEVDRPMLSTWLSEEGMVHGMSDAEVSAIHDGFLAQEDAIGALGRAAFTEFARLAIARG